MITMSLPPRKEGPAGGDLAEPGLGLLSIGELAQATGVTPDTIRVWERRYGRPSPVRLESGHRRYTREHVRWLRQVAEALARGHRPARVVRMDDAEIRGLLRAGQSAQETAPEIRRLLDRVRVLDGPGLTAELSARANELGPVAFLTTIVSPLLDAVGRNWVEGEIDIRHEHHLSGVLDDVMRTLRLDTVVPDQAPVIVLATLTGEAHGLGLQMTALLLAVRGVRPAIIGTHTPAVEIAAAATELGAAAVGISISLATGGVDTDRVIAELRRLLPRPVRLLVGGRGARGARRGPRGVEYAADMPAVERWLEEMRVGT